VSVRIGDVDTLVATVRDDPDVLGVVLLGSAADTARADEWSDVDLFLVVPDGRQDRYREDLSWLPDHERIVLVARETQHGRAVVFDDGRLVELAVASPREIAADFRASQWRVAFDRGGVAEAVAAIAVSPPAAPDRERAGRALAMLCGRMLVGVGRARRGEVVSAGEMVRSLAVADLLVALRELRSPATPAELAPSQPDDAPRVARGGLDPLDVRRRVERAYPRQAAALAGACRLDVEPCARRLLDLAEEWFAAEPQWPAAGVAAVRQRLGWPVAAAG
jgi:predicted nucleotidyltransferase